MNPDLHQFVRECLARGVGRDAIRQQLANAGWRAEEIDPTLAAWADTPFEVPVPRRRPYLSAHEAFLYLVLFVTLYVTAFNVGALLFQFIERWLPDPALRQPWGPDRFEPRAVRDASASLVIAFPVFLILSRAIGTMLARDPEKRESKVRKWLTYVTLFVAALVILGDLIVLVGRLLSGELAPRFVAKVLVVLVIAGFVFGHYLGELRRDESERAEPVRRHHWAARLAGAGVFAVLAIALFVAGSPRRARLEEIDQRRVRELQGISNAIDQYHRERHALPPALDALLVQPNINVESVQDPTTQRPYEYAPIDSTTYELCATFDAVDTTGATPEWAPRRASRFWRHPAGRHCYRLEVTRAPEVPARP